MPWKIGTMATHLGFWMPGMLETVVILVVGLVIFGGNLPEVGKSVGRSLIEFRKGLRDLKTSAGLDEVTKVKDEILGMAREVDPRRMMDIDDAHLPDDPYADVYKEGEYNEVESSKTDADAPATDDDESVATPDNDSEGSESSKDRSVGDSSATEGSEPVVPEDDGGIGESDYTPPQLRKEVGRLEGNQREPHEEDEPPTFGYDRHA